MAAGDISKKFLSASSNGRNIKVAATTTAGTLLHTAHATDTDEVWLWAVNTSASAVLLTLEAGGTTAPDDNEPVTVQPRSGRALVLPGQTYTGSVAIRAFAATANVIVIGGFVNRIGA